MFVNRACIDGVGLFDVEAFPRGYGEATFMRSGRAGWANPDRRCLCSTIEKVSAMQRNRSDGPWPTRRVELPSEQRYTRLLDKRCKNQHNAVLLCSTDFAGLQQRRQATYDRLRRIRRPEVRLSD
jgi:hypothetical protein